MGARCAACLAPLGHKTHRVVADTEVFHEHCIQQIPQSLGNRRARRIVELQGQVKQLEADSAELARLRTAIDDRDRDARALRADRDRFAAELCELKAADRTTASSNTYYQGIAQQRATENERLARELEAARREVLLHQTIQQGTGPAQRGDPKTPPPAEKHTGMWEDMETRFGLLEIEEKK